MMYTVIMRTDLFLLNNIFYIMINLFKSLYGFILVFFIDSNVFVLVFIGFLAIVTGCKVQEGPLYAVTTLEQVDILWLEIFLKLVEFKHEFLRLFFNDLFVFLMLIIEIVWFCWCETWLLRMFLLVLIWWGLTWAPL